MSRSQKTSPRPIWLVPILLVLSHLPFFGLAADPAAYLTADSLSGESPAADSLAANLAVSLYAMSSKTVELLTSAFINTSSTSEKYT